MPDYDPADRYLEDRLRRALRWMANDAEAVTTHLHEPLVTRTTRFSATDSNPSHEAGLYLDEPTSTAPSRRAIRKPVIAAAAALILVAVGVPLGIAASRGNTHGSGLERTSGVPGSTAREQVVSALSATTSSGNWDISYTYGEISGSEPPPTPTTTSCPASQDPVCTVAPDGASTQQNVTVTGTGIINVNPKAMVVDANVSDFGHVVLRVDSSQVWEILSGDSGGLAPDPGEEQIGQSLPGYAGLVEGTLGTREGAVAMLGIASPTGYLELDEQAIMGVTPAKTGTVDGQAVAQYKVSVQPSELASDPSASPSQASAIQAALAALDGAGMSATSDQVAVDAQGFIVQSISTYEFSDGGSVRVQADFSNFGCAGTVLMPGQTGSTAPAAACASPDTGGNGAPASTSTTTTAPTPTTSPQNAVVLGPVGTVPTTTPPQNGSTTTSSLPAGASSSVTRAQCPWGQSGRGDVRARGGRPPR